MSSSKRTWQYYSLAFRKHDFRSSITVFFVALPLCMGVALASGAPVFAGMAAGMIGGMVVTLVSNSQLSVSGPAAGLTSICAAAILSLGSYEAFAMAVLVAGLLQIAMGLFKLGGFTHFIPSAVIKGMLAAIGIILISKQIPMVIGYNKPDFWRNELVNLITFNHGFQNVENLLDSISAGSIICAAVAGLALSLWRKHMSSKKSFIPASFVAVATGTLISLAMNRYVPSLSLSSHQLVSLPADWLSSLRFPSFNLLWTQPAIWQTALLISLVASLETLLSIEAIDKLDPYNRITHQNRELVAQGLGNMVSGMVGGLPITAVIVRSSANAEAGAKTKLSAFFHGIWLLLAVVFAQMLIGKIPYAVLAVILIRTGFNLAKPSMIMAVYRQGREQFMPFMVTVFAILFTDLLIGVLIGVAYSVYFLIKHTYRAGFLVEEKKEGHIRHFTIHLALNVSFLNKRRFTETLDKMPEYSIVEIDGTGSVYIDYDVLEIFQNFKAKAHTRHIQLILKNIPEVQTIELH